MTGSAEACVCGRTEGQSGQAELEAPHGDGATTMLAFQLGPVQTALWGLGR